MNYRLLSFPFVLLLIAPALAVAQDSRPAATTKAKVETWTVQPQAASQAALRYRLLPPFSEQKPGNAASLYYAAALFPQDRHRIQRTVNGQTVDVDPSDRADELLDLPPEKFAVDEAKSLLNSEFSNVLEYLDLAARREECDWGHALRERGFDALLPELNPLRSASQQLRLRLRVEIFERRYDDAVRSLQTGFVLARHTAQGRSVVNSMVGAGISRSFIESARDLAAAPGAPNLYWAWADLPHPMISVRDALEYERAIMASKLQVDELSPQTALSNRQINRILDSLSTWGPGVTVIQSRAAFALRAAGDLPQARRFLLGDGVSQQQLAALPDLQIALLYYARTFQYGFDAKAKYAGLPFHIGFPMAVADESWQSTLEAHPFQRAMMRGVHQVWRSTGSVDRQIVAMQVIESIRAFAAAHDGRPPQSLEQLKEMPAPADPLTNRPFAYEAKGDTFTLSAPELPGGVKPLMFEVTISR